MTASDGRRSAWRRSSTVPGFDEAASELLVFFESNTWFVETFWEENRDRIRLMAADAVAMRPPGRNVRVLDIGCFNGFSSFIFGRLGYGVTASDEVDLPERAELLSRVGGDFFRANFNQIGAYRQLPEASFDIVLMGEVFEHILNHPFGVLQDIGRLLRENGLLILTTPNPSTLMKAFRIVTNRGATRGSREFAEMPKVLNEREIISHAGIHYHEYFGPELDRLLTEAGFRIAISRHIPIGASRDQSSVKRAIKQSALGTALLTHRLLGATHYRVAEKIR